MRRSKIFYLRIIVELLVLLTVAMMTINGKLQMWFIVFLAGTVLSIFAGRLFCGWVCPMNTLFRGINWIYRKLKIIRIQTPSFMKKPIIRYLFLLVFIGLIVFIKVKRLNINVLLYLILASFVITMIFTEDFWHRTICPFGTILNLSSRKARYSMTIDEEDCTGCGLCQKHCPSQSIKTQEDRKRRNVKQECLLCYQCVDICPTEVCLISGKN